MMGDMDINAWLNIDKPAEYSSAKVVAIVKRVLGVSKAGHGGTLDPLATGVLPIAIGEATKTVSYVMEAPKAYRFSTYFGVARDTGDGEGEIVGRSDKVPTEAEVLAILPHFTGIQKQRPHKYSAVKVGGRRAYDMARAGADFALDTREITIHSLKLLGHEKMVFHFEVRCSKGTYVRCLASDMAEKLGTLGYVCRLRRTACGKFNEANAISLDFLEKTGNTEALEKVLIPIKDTLDDIPGIVLSEEDAVRIKHGQRLKQPDLNGEGQVLKAESGGNLIALVCADGDILRPVRIFNL